MPVLVKRVMGVAVALALSAAQLEVPRISVFSALFGIFVGVSRVPPYS